ncbi:ATP-binding cassette domain-containing protein [Collinsella tanakaei]|uniref:ATP-binding cassette domain-containing protein n=1 Tax=Collinsella tanakaei TaxID=626935 RepID=UPI001F1740AC|nr:ATP-binding cassette domain-containing protein [Collinsella tanakaei]
MMQLVRHVGSPSSSMGGAAPSAHGPHGDAEFHHHHSHAAISRHPDNHHLLTVEHLSVSFDMYDPVAPFFRAGRVVCEQLHDVTLSVHRGEILAVVGASGSGKTLLADALLGLYEQNTLVSGHIWFDGEAVDADALERLRGRGISLVPQSVSHLDPLMRVGEQIVGACHGRRRAERRERMRLLLEHYGLSPEVERLYPHELSGGMARRVLLICALMDEPQLIVADEPTPGLDMERAVQALRDLRGFADGGGGVLLITHDVELALRVADRIAVFHDGTVVEETAVGNFAAPELLRDPFTRALWHAMPEHGMVVEGDRALGAAPSKVRRGMSDGGDCR